MFHIECIWFVYAQFLQTELDKVKQEWNYHKISIRKVVKFLEFRINYIIYLKVIFPKVFVSLSLMLQMLQHNEIMKMSSAKL